MEPQLKNERSGYRPHTNSSVEDGGNDAHLWHLARRRASFKSHLTTYLVMSAFFWLVWYFSGASTYGTRIPWPVWPMLGWGIGVFFHYTSAYAPNRTNAVEREYLKLKQEQNNSNQQ